LPVLTYRASRRRSLDDSVMSDIRPESYIPVGHSPDTPSETC
jgi:hypothetical protein